MVKGTSTKLQQEHANKNKAKTIKKEEIHSLGMFFIVWFWANNTWDIPGKFFFLDQQIVI